MSAKSMALGAQPKRFAAYLDRLAHAAGHQDRVAPLKSYCTGLLLPGERKSVEPMAARLCPENVRRLWCKYLSRAWQHLSIGLGFIRRALHSRSRAQPCL